MSTHRPSLDTALSSEWDLFSVTVPTRDRPAKLRRCLESLAAARERTDFTAFVCDSSADPRVRDEVADACEPFGFVTLHHHRARTKPAARNFCARVARSQLIITVDDDVYVEPDAIGRLVSAYRAATGPRVVEGSLQIGGNWMGPGAMRPIGYGRPTLPEEAQSVVTTGLLLYPRAFAFAWPWNERVPSREDRFMSSLWRRHGVQLLHEPSARGIHDGIPCADVDDQESRIYANLFDALIASPAPLRAAGYELLGFAAGAKLYCRRPADALRFIRAWTRGHRSLMRDWRELRALCEAMPPLEPSTYSPEPRTQMIDVVAAGKS